MNFDKINRYINRLYQESDHINRERFQDETELNDFVPVVEDDVARFLKQLIHMLRVKEILEIGTSIGYSTFSMALAAGELKGKITTIEYNEKVAMQARKNFERTGVSESIEILIGDAREIMPNLDGEYDLIFQDADKTLYPLLLDDCIRLLKPGGVMIAEDTLFPVIELEPKWHYLIPPVEEFNRLVSSDRRIESTILPLGDGLTVALKK